MAPPGTASRTARWRFLSLRLMQTGTDARPSSHSTTSCQDAAGAAVRNGALQLGARAAQTQRIFSNSTDPRRTLLKLREHPRQTRTDQHHVPNALSNCPPTSKDHNNRHTKRQSGAPSNKTRQTNSIGHRLDRFATDFRGGWGHHDVPSHTGLVPSAVRLWVV